MYSCCSMVCQSIHIVPQLRNCSSTTVKSCTSITCGGLWRKESRINKISFFFREFRIWSKEWWCCESCARWIFTRKHKCFEWFDNSFVWIIIFWSSSVVRSSGNFHCCYISIGDWFCFYEFQQHELKIYARTLYTCRP